MKKLLLLFSLFLIGVSFAQEYGVAPAEIFIASPSKEKYLSVFCFFNNLEEDLIFSVRSGSIRVEDKDILVKGKTGFDKCYSDTVYHFPIRSGNFFFFVKKASQPNLVIDRIEIKVTVPEQREESVVPSKFPILNQTVSTLNTETERRGFFEDGKFYFGLGIGFVLGIIATVFYFILL